MREKISLNKKDMKILAMVGTKIVGRLHFKYPNDDSRKRNLEIDWLSVNNNYRRKGIATRMLELLLASYQDVVWISLWTGKDSEIDGSWKLYLKLGFVQQTYQADYYTNNIGTRLMVKRQ